MPVNLDRSSSEIGSVFFCRQTGMSELSANSVVREASQENNGNVSGLQICQTVNEDSKNMHVLLGQTFSGMPPKVVKKKLMPAHPTICISDINNDKQLIQWIQVEFL